MRRTRATARAELGPAALKRLTKPITSLRSGRHSRSLSYKPSATRAASTAAKASCNDP